MVALNLNESFGEEDLILNRKRAYTVECQTAGGQLRIINRKNFFQRVMRDEGTARFLEDKVKTQEEWFQAKFQEIKTIREGIVQKTEDKKITALKMEGGTMPKSNSLPQFITLKKTLMKMEKGHFDPKKEKATEESNSFIFKKMKILEDRQRFFDNSFNSKKKTFKEK